MPVFLDPDEKHAFRAVKVIHNALLADRFPPADRPKKSDFTRGWPQDVQELVLSRWRGYGYEDTGN